MTHARWCLAAVRHGLGGERAASRPAASIAALSAELTVRTKSSRRDRAVLHVRGMALRVTHAIRTQSEKIPTLSRRCRVGDGKVTTAKEYVESTLLLLLLLLPLLLLRLRRLQPAPHFAPLLKH